MPPQPPYVISGIIKDATSTVLEGATVAVYDLINGQVASTTSNSSGEYNLTLSVYTNGDILLLRAYKRDSFFKYIEVRVVLNSDVGATEKDLTLLVSDPQQISSINESEVAILEHHPLYLSRRVSIIGETDTGEIIPLKLKKDSTGRLGQIDVVNNPQTRKMTVLDTVTASVSASGTLSQSYTFASKSKIKFIRFYASASTNYDVYVYDNSQMRDQDELMRQLNAGARGITGDRIYSEHFRDIDGIMYYDRSSGNQIHIKIVNQDASNASTFSITILGEEMG